MRLNRNNGISLASLRGHPSALARTTLRKCAAVALAFGFAADHSDHFDDFDRHTFITKRFINIFTKMRAVFLALMLSIFDKANSAAIDEDFGKFFNGARPFRRSENAKISDLAKGKRIKGYSRRRNFYRFLTSTCSNGLRRILLARAGRRRRSHLG